MDDLRLVTPSALSLPHRVVKIKEVPQHQWYKVVQNELGISGTKEVPMARTDSAAWLECAHPCYAPFPKCLFRTSLIRLHLLNSIQLCRLDCTRFPCSSFTMTGNSTRPLYRRVRTAKFPHWCELNELPKTEMKPTLGCLRSITQVPNSTTKASSLASPGRVRKDPSVKQLPTTVDHNELNSLRWTDVTS